jgi:ATP-binding cassette subfamily B protein
VDDPLPSPARAAAPAAAPGAKPAPGSELGATTGGRAATPEPVRRVGDAAWPVADRERGREREPEPGSARKPDSGPARGGPAVGRALGYLRRYRLETAGAALALLLVAAANLAAPAMVRLAIDAGLAQRRWTTVLWAVAGLIGIAGGRGLFNFAQGYLAERASQGVAFDMRDALFERIQRLGFSYYDRVETGQLLTRLTNDVEQVRTFVGAGVVQLAASLVMLLGSAVLLVRINPALAALALLAIAPIFGLLRVFVRSVGPLFGRIQATLGRLNGILQEDLQGLRVVRAFSAEAREAERYGRVNNELRDLNLSVVGAVSNNFPFVNFFANLGTLVVVGFGGVQIFMDRLTIGELIAFNSYLGFLLMPIMQIGFLAAQISRAGASAQRIFELLDAPLEVADRPGAAPLPPVVGRVEFKDVHFRYAGSDREILRGVSFIVEPGQTVAVLGTTGAGKSTITNLIPRFYDVTGGAVLIDGHDVREVQLASLRSQVGIVLQEALLFSGTVRDNIAYGRPDATDEQVRSAAVAAQAADFIEALPARYETVIGERGIGLSGGQRQRIAIARALLTDPRLLILDDSTSAVDAETELAIQQALDGLMRKQGCTAFVIAQRISTVRDADLILILDEGKIAAAGRHEELLETSRLYDEILGSQLGRPAERPAMKDDAA